MLIEKMNKEFFKNVLTEEDFSFLEETIKKVQNIEKLNIKEESTILDISTTWVNEFSIILVEFFRDKLEYALNKMIFNNHKDIIDFIKDDEKYEKFLNEVFRYNEIQITDNDFLNTELTNKYLEMISLYKLYFITGFKEGALNGIFSNYLINNNKIIVKDILLHGALFLNNNIVNKNKEQISLFQTKRGFPLYYCKFNSEDELYFAEHEIEISFLSNDLFKEDQIVFRKEFFTLCDILLNVFYSNSFNMGNEKLSQNLNLIQVEKDKIVYLSQLNDFDIINYIVYSENNEKFLPLKVISLLNKNLIFEHKLILLDQIIKYLKSDKEISIETVKDILSILNNLAKTTYERIILDMLFVFANNSKNIRLLNSVSDNPFVHSYMNDTLLSLKTNKTEENVIEYSERIKETKNIYFFISKNLTEVEQNDVIERINNLRVKNLFDFEHIDIRGFHFSMMAIIFNNKILLSYFLQNCNNVNDYNFSNQNIMNYAVHNESEELIITIIENEKINELIKNQAENYLINSGRI